MSELRYTVAMPPGATGGKWILTPQAQHPVGDVVVALPHTGEITATGVLVSDGAAPDLPASVPGEDVASPEYLLELSYTRAGRQVPGVPVRLRMVETEPGIVDAAQLLREGRALAVTPEQLVSLRTAEEAALEAAQSVTAATLDLSGERERVQQALADTAQSAALAVSAAGITPVADLAGIGAEPGLYRTMNNGQVWKRPEGGGDPVRQDKLEAAPMSADLARRNVALADLADRGQTDGPQFVDGSRWVWAAGGTPDGGTVVAASGGGVWAREYYGPVRPEWFGARGDGVQDDTLYLSAAINNHPHVALQRGRVYRVTAPIQAYNMVRIDFEGPQFRQLDGFTDDATVSRARAARIIWKPAAAPTVDTAVLTLLRSGSTINNPEIIYTDQPPEDPDSLTWTPVETGWAIDVKGAWCEINNPIIRGFRFGIRGGRYQGAECAGIKITAPYLGVYDEGIRIEQASDVPRIVGGTHQTIWQLTNGFNDRKILRYMLNNLIVIRMKRADNPVLDDVFCIFANTAVLLENQTPKVKIGNLEADECLFAVRALGNFDLLADTIIHQRLPEGGYGGVTTGTDAGATIETTAGAVGSIQVANVYSRLSRRSALYLDGTVDATVGSLRVRDYNLAGAGYAAVQATTSVVVRLGAAPQISTTQADSTPYTIAGELRGQFSASQTPGELTIAAGASADFGVIVPGALGMHTATVSAEGWLPSGVTAQACVTGPGVMTVRVRNAGSSQVVVPALTWRVTASS